MSLHVLQLAHRQLPQQKQQCTCSQLYRVCTVYGQWPRQIRAYPVERGRSPKPHTPPQLVGCYFGLHSVPVTGGQLHDSSQQTRRNFSNNCSRPRLSSPRGGGGGPPVFSPFPFPWKGGNTQVSSKSPGCNFLKNGAGPLFRGPGGGGEATVCLRHC